MSNTAFSSKKIQTKKSNWLKKTVISSTIAAVISALGFGVYHASKTTGETSNSGNRQLHFAHSQVNTVPAYANKSAKSRVHKRSNTVTHKKKSAKHTVSKHKKPSKKIAAHKKRSKSGKADLSKLSKHHKKQLAKAKKSKRPGKNLAAK